MLRTNKVNYKIMDVHCSMGRAWMGRCTVARRIIIIPILLGFSLGYVSCDHNQKKRKDIIGEWSVIREDTSQIKLRINDSLFISKVGNAMELKFTYHFINDSTIECLRKIAIPKEVTSDHKPTNVIDKRVWVIRKVGESELVLYEIEDYTELVFTKVR